RDLCDMEPGLPEVCGRYRRRRAVFAEPHHRRCEPRHRQVSALASRAALRHTQPRWLAHHVAHAAFAVTARAVGDRIRLGPTAHALHAIDAVDELLIIVGPARAPRFGQRHGNLAIEVCGDLEYFRLARLASSNGRGERAVVELPHRHPTLLSWGMGINEA